jgi:hypothetical protein
VACSGDGKPIATRGTSAIPGAFTDVWYARMWRVGPAAHHRGGGRRPRRESIRSHDARSSAAISALEGKRSREGRHLRGVKAAGEKAAGRRSHNNGRRLLSRRTTRQRASHLLREARRSRIADRARTPCTATRAPGAGSSRPSAARHGRHHP